MDKAQAKVLILLLETYLEWYKKWILDWEKDWVGAWFVDWMQTSINLIYDNFVKEETEEE